MTISIGDRLENARLALRLCVQAVGDFTINEVTLDTNDAIFSGIIPTTWSELHQQHLVVHIKDTSIYYLTGPGWLKGLEISGILDDPQFKAKAGRLSATLKRYLNGRNEALVSTFDVEKGSGLPYGFVHNAIDSKLLRKLFNEKGADWYSLKPAKMIIRIPSNFGHDPLNL